MKLHSLKPAEGSTHSRRRIGRGPGSGLGGTSTRGHKGAKARSGYKKKIGFEGGQMPLQRRVPKSGFKNINRVEYKAINLDVIQALAEAKNLTAVTLANYQNLTNEKIHRDIKEYMASGGFENPSAHYNIVCRYI